MQELSKCQVKPNQTEQRGESNFSSCQDLSAAAAAVVCGRKNSPQPVVHSTFQPRSPHVHNAECFGETNKLIVVFFKFYLLVAENLSVCSPDFRRTLPRLSVVF